MFDLIQEVQMDTEMTTTCINERKGKNFCCFGFDDMEYLLACMQMGRKLFARVSILSGFDSLLVDDTAAQSGTLDLRPHPSEPEAKSARLPHTIFPSFLSSSLLFPSLSHRLWLSLTPPSLPLL